MQSSPIVDHVEAFTKTRGEVLLMIVGVLLVFLTIPMAFVLASGLLGSEVGLGAVLASVIAVIVLLLIGTMVSLVGMYAKY